ncbi:MAG: hypothetical protein FJY95_10810 [Candidatus Handelsmanbacteria bacterium]|nr:hypothetical protein [Candidatus Handelsmanbacteria bacterium]
MPLDEGLRLPAGSTPEDQLMRKELGKRVQAAIAALLENQRLLLVLGAQL